MYVLMIISVILMISYEVQAVDFWEQAKDWIDTGMEGESESYIGAETGTLGIYSKLFGMKNNAKNEFQKVLDFLWSIGLLTIFIRSICGSYFWSCIFISTVVLGIKYMLVPPNEKSRIKQATTPYIIGVIIIFGAVTIWKFVIDVLNGSL